MLNGNTLIKQFRHETETWKRTLGFIEEENIILKNRLSEILATANKYDDSLISTLEIFQNSFIDKDDLIKLLKDNITEEDKLLTREAFEDGSLLTFVKNKQKKLRKDMEEIEQKFQKLKTDFNSYLSDIY